MALAITIFYSPELKHAKQTKNNANNKTPYYCSNDTLFILFSLPYL